MKQCFRLLSELYSLLSLNCCPDSYAGIIYSFRLLSELYSLLLKKLEILKQKIFKSFRLLSELYSLLLQGGEK